MVDFSAMKAFPFSYLLPKNITYCWLQIWNLTGCSRGSKWCGKIFCHIIIIILVWMIIHHPTSGWVVTVIFEGLKSLLTFHVNYTCRGAVKPCMLIMHSSMAPESIACILNSNFSKQTKVLAALSHGGVCIKTLSARLVKPNSEKRPSSALQSLKWD